jgi:hypothetical protein
MPAGGITAAPVAPQSVVLQLDGPTTQAVLEGRAVQAVAANPRTVAAANVQGQKANVGRSSSLAMQLSPGMVTS